jgi:hypothetical protein
MHRRWHAHAVAIGLILSFGACERPAAEPRDETPRTVVRDSGGVRIVSAGFSRDPLDVSEQVRIIDTLLDGASADAEAVVGLVALQPLADSSLVLFSESGPALLRYAAPRFDRPDTLGHAGTEPGSYGPRATLLPYFPDTLLLWDRESGRLSRVTAAGIGDPVLLEYPLFQLAAVSGALADGRAIAVAGAPLRAEDAGLSRPPVVLLAFSNDGARVDTLLTLRGAERTVQVGRPGMSGDNVPVRSGSVPFGRTTLWTVGTNSLLTLDTEGCHVERRDGTGRLTLRLDFQCAIEAVTQQDREKFLSEVLATAQSRSDSAIRTRFVREASFPPSKSTASGLLTDPWDRIWVRLPVSSSTEDWLWWVFAPDGMPIVRLSLGRQWRIAAVRGRDLIAVQTDRDDAPPVVVRMALPDALHQTP